MTKPNERPILFSGPMVRAILENRKTMTRRVVVPQPECTGKMNAFTDFEQDAWRWNGGNALLRASYGATYVHTDRVAMERAMLRASVFQIGTQLWVRETWIGSEKTMRGYFRADMQYWDHSKNIPRPECGQPESCKWKPAIFMPRWASRITLEITSVRIERVQDISEDDAKAEGATGDFKSNVANFKRLWNSINLPRAGCAWDSNPFVFVISFRRL